MALFSRSGARNALSTFVRSSEEGGSTDSCALQSARLLLAGFTPILWDDVLAGFVSDPAIFAAAVSHIASASMAPSKLEELAGVKTIKALRVLAKDVDASIVTTNDGALSAFLRGVAALGADGRVWLLLVAASLAGLRADAQLRPLIYPNLK